MARGLLWKMYQKFIIRGGCKIYFRVVPHQMFRRGCVAISGARDC